MAMLGPLPVAALHARTAGYDIVLLAHVLAALVSLVVVAIAGASAVSLRSPGPPSDALRRYYRPGPNWSGRVLFLVPVLGAALVWMSRGDWSFSDGWVVIGLGAWLVAALGAELVLWPAERRLRDWVAAGETTRTIRTECRRAAFAAALIGVVLVAATVVMVAKP